MTLITHYSNLIWIILGILISIYSLNLGVWSNIGPETGFFPFISGVLISLGAVLNWAKHRLETPVILPVRKSRFLVLLIVATLLFLALTAKTAGFLLASTTCVLVLTVAADPPRWRRSLAWGVCSSVVIYFLFTRIFNVPLPRGVLGI